jgi:hypothetical protein
MSDAPAPAPAPAAKGFKSKELVGDELVVCFSLARTFKLPSLYEEGTADAIQKALQLGADAWQAVRDIEAEAGTTAAATGAQARAIKAAEEKAAKATWKLEQDVERLKREREEVVEEAARLRAEFSGLQASFQERLEVAKQGAAAEAERRAVSLESKLEGLQAAFRMMKDVEEGRVERLQAAEEARVERLQVAEAARRAELLEAKEAMITVLKADKAAAAAELAVVQEALLARRGAKSNSAIKGQLGEEDFADMAAGQHWGLERTAKESRSCDYRGYVAGMPVFFEIKAHEKRVATAEVDKFKRDINEHPEVGAGVFLALHTGIAGSRTSFWTEYTGDGRLLVFVSDAFSSGEEVARMHLAAIHQLLIVAVHMNKARLAGESGVLEEYKSRVEAAEKYIMVVSNRARELVNKMHNDKRNLQQALVQSFDHLTIMARSLQMDIQMTLGALLGTAVKFEEEDAVSTSPNTAEASASTDMTATSPSSKKKSSARKTASK